MDHIYKEQLFFDHAPILVDYEFMLQGLIGKGARLLVVASAVLHAA